jgi:hypothetical protein
MKKRTIRITESQLSRIIKNIVSEQVHDTTRYQSQRDKYYHDKDVEYMNPYNEKRMVKNLNDMIQFLSDPNKTADEKAYYKERFIPTQFHENSVITDEVLKSKGLQYQYNAMDWYDLIIDMVERGEDLDYKIGLKSWKYAGLPTDREVTRKSKFKDLSASRKLISATFG